jgi:hypothetical protein
VHVFRHIDQLDVAAIDPEVGPHGAQGIFDAFEQVLLIRF